MYITLVAGAGSKLFESLIMFPLDTIKTRLQFQGDFSKSSIRNKYSGILNAIYTSAKTEGIKTFFRGYIPHTLYVLPASGISFLCYESIVKEAKKSHKYKTMMTEIGTIKSNGDKTEQGYIVLPILAMVGARVIGSVIRTPFDIIKMRQQVSGSLVNENYKQINSNSLRSFKRIIETDGYRGLFKFSSVSLLRDLPFTGIYFYSYGKCRNLQKKWINKDLKRNEKKKKLSPINNLIAGGFSGALGTILTIPIDVVKTNLQLQDACLPKDKRFNGVIDCFKYIIKTEGYKGLTKGLGTRLVHIIPSAALSFASYEWIKKKLSKK
ncbi:hypothetical protein DICPUDRAFT_90316 [Dictyostelium purpureum]|uniref:Mitochondrial substrate carrier family protein n=1 Tax=Dictyostelium purpureum TaxID=5786 RepID=F1A1R8_DICPU|nr:uncharacterized protein DICPUDRAFT_90316 [Dictyostelium purpureum]EGC29856.1 hypothetical protein DICPUDRAFT_90316 [Dictyostelium purpureum]|eukprot:XP_003293611.1 hypothetical protein DICPUDRAFT_90316 [Dictyostelium purpureum]